MNAKTRVQGRKIIEALKDAQFALQELLEGEQEKLENMPESRQGGEKGDALANAIGDLEQADMSLEITLQSLNDACGCEA